LFGWLVDTSDVIAPEPNPRRPAIVHDFRRDDD